MIDNRDDDNECFLLTYSGCRIDEGGRGCKQAGYYVCLDEFEADLDKAPDDGYESLDK